MKALTDLTLIVRRSTEVGELIREIELTRPDNAPLPAFQAGAHILLTLPSGAENA